MALTELGQLIGAANGISLERSDEGLAFLQRAFDTADELTHRDPTDVDSRGLLSTAGRPLGALLRPHDAQRSVEVYDHVLRHLGEIKDNTQFRHEEVRALVGSTYPLRTLGDHAEAQRRLSDAFSRLSEMKMYPAEKVEIGSEVDEALRARADSEAAGGNAGRSGGVVSAAPRSDHGGEAVGREQPDGDQRAVQPVRVAGLALSACPATRILRGRSRHGAWRCGRTGIASFRRTPSSSAGWRPCACNRGQICSCRSVLFLGNPRKRTNVQETRSDPQLQRLPPPARTRADPRDINQRLAHAIELQVLLDA